MQFLIFLIHVLMAKGCLISLERKAKMNQLKPLPQIHWSILIFFSLVILTLSVPQLQLLMGIDRNKALEKTCS